MQSIPAQPLDKWTAMDDWLLVQAVQQTGDLVAVRHHVKFSTPRSAREIEGRWAQLLLNESASSAAAERLRSLNPQPSELASNNVPWSDAELAFVVASPVWKVCGAEIPPGLTIDDDRDTPQKPKGAVPRYTATEAQNVLLAGQTVFHPCRTPMAVAHLMSRLWFFEHQAELAIGYVGATSVGSRPDRRTLAIAGTDIERYPLKLQDALRWTMPLDTSSSLELSIAAMHRRKTALKRGAGAPSSANVVGGQVDVDTGVVSEGASAEEDIDVGVEETEPSANPLDAATETGKDESSDQQLDQQQQQDAFLHQRRLLRQLENEVASDRFFEYGRRTIAVLRGEFARFEIRSKEVMIGHKTETNNVDVDLSKAGPVSRVSRRQAILRLEPDCKFHLLNLGARPIYICGEPLLSGTATALRDGDLLEIGGVPLIFNTNNWLLNKARKQIQP